jgi:CP family cyanate transporter-like MFS transporter
MCLRLTVLAIPPVIPLLHADLHLSETAIGWLSSLPPMLFAVAAVPGALLIARFGVIPALLVGLLLNAVGAAARGATTDVTSLYISTIVMAAGVSIMQPALPPLVRAWFPQRVGFATAVYTNGLLIGEILVVALTIPLVLPLVRDSWRLNFVIWAIPVLITALLVAVWARGLGARGLGGIANAPNAKKLRWWPEWRSPLIWRLGLILGSVNTTYFVANAFLPDYVVAAGRPDLVSASLTSLNLAQLP